MNSSEGGKALRKRMAAKKIDYLVVQSQNRGVGGYFRWFTDLPGGNYPNAAVFPLEGDMAIIYARPGIAGAAGQSARLGAPGRQGEVQHARLPQRLVGGWLGRGKGRGVHAAEETPQGRASSGWGNMSAALYENVKKGLPGVEFINATDLVDEAPDGQERRGTHAAPGSGLHARDELRGRQGGDRARQDRRGGHPGHPVSRRWKRAARSSRWPSPSARRPVPT